MKKVLLIIFGSIAAAGLVLGIVGFALGGWFGRVVFDDGRLVYADRDSVRELQDAPWWMRNWKGTWQLFGWGYQGDDAVANWDGWDYDEADVAAEANAVAVTDRIDAPFSAPGAEVRVDIDISAGYLTVKTGESWGLEVRGPLETTAEMENGVWKLRSKTNLNNVRSSSENWESRPRFYRDGVDVTTDYILTLPADVGELEADLGMGVVNISDLNMQKSDFSLDLGLMRVNGCTADRAEFSVDLGAAEVNGFTARDCDIEVELGSMEYTGDVTEVLKANCDLGAIDCTLKRPADYGYRVDVDLGGVTVDGVGLASGSRNESMTPRYELECELGAIDVSFE